MFRVMKVVYFETESGMSCSEPVRMSNVDYHFGCYADQLAKRFNDTEAYDGEEYYVQFIGERHTTPTPMPSLIDQMADDIPF